MNTTARRPDFLVEAHAAGIAFVGTFAAGFAAASFSRRCRTRRKGKGNIGVAPSFAIAGGDCCRCGSREPRAAIARQATADTPGSNSSNSDFPWYFRGRVRFRPALVSAPQSVTEGVRPISLFGLSIGGFVCLEYDESPVGPYFEVVQMAAAVFSERLWTAALWGSRLMVNDKEADRANGDVWGVPSECRDIVFESDGDPAVFADQGTGSLHIGGWSDMRFADAGAEPWGQLPIWWTPTLKALWAPISLWKDDNAGGTLPLRRLRLSAASLRLRWAPAGDGGDAAVPSVGEDSKSVASTSIEEAWRVPLPLVIEADGVLIEIGREFDRL